MDTSCVPEFDLHLSVHLSRFEAEGLAHLCHLMEWQYLAEHSHAIGQATEARYALAKLRFALADAGFSAMPSDEGGNLG